MNRAIKQVATACAVLTLGMTAGCGGSSSQTGSPERSQPSTANSSSGAPSAGASLMDLVPPEIRDKGTVEGGSNFAGKPIDFYNDKHQPDGAMMDLLAEAAKRLGLQIHWTEITYSGLIPALQSGRIVLAGAQISRTPENSDVVNNFAFYQASSSLLVQKGTDYTSAQDVCGTTVGVTASSTLDQNTAKQINEDCTKAGKRAVDIRTFNGPTAGVTAVRSGQIDSYLESTTLIVTQVQEQPSLGVTLKAQFAKRLTGTVFAKSQLDLTKAFQAAMNQMVDDGTYGKILDKWQLADIAVPKVLINEEIDAAS